jgi:hypothetical protein
MARLQVGDIAIDGSDIRIGGAKPGSPDGGDTTQSVEDLRSGIQFLDRVPFSGRFLIACGVVVAIAGTIINVALGAWNNPIGALMGGGVLAPLGIGIAVLGAAGEYLRRRPHLRHRAALVGDPQTYLATLRQLLAHSRPDQTVPWIVHRTGWSEGTVVHALALLRSSGELLEELDLDTGEFYYVVPTNPFTLAPADLDTRLGTLTPQGARRK